MLQTWPAAYEKAVIPAASRLLHSCLSSDLPASAGAREAAVVSAASVTAAAAPAGLSACSTKLLWVATSTAVHPRKASMACRGGH